MKLNALTTGILLMITPMIMGQSKDFTPQDLWKLKRLNGGVVSPDQNKVLYQTAEMDVKNNDSKNEYCVFELKKNKCMKMADKNKDLTQIQWGQNEDVYGVIVKEDKKSIVATTLEKPTHKIVLEKDAKTLIDYKISPDEKYILTLEKVKTKNTTADLYPDYPEANVKIIDDLMYRHWDTWEDEYSDQLVLYTLDKGTAKDGVNLLEGTEFHGILPPFGGLENVVFLDSETIIYSSKKKTGVKAATSTNSELYAYHIETGETENWTEAFQGYDTHPVIHNATNQLGWLSMANDGFEADKNDIIIRDLATQSNTNLTGDIDLTVSDFIWNEKGDKIYFLADYEATIQIFELDVKTKDYRQITEGDYNYTSLGLAGKDIITMRHDMLHPNELFKVNIKTGKTTQLTHANDEFLAEFSAPKIEKRWITTSDNKKMLTWVILPPNFDENKKYPTLLYCQGGPQSAVNQFFSYRWNFRLMASQGYVVVAPNRRGLPGFGQKWNDAISKDWGGQPMKDYLAAIDDVSKEKYVDKERLGAVGASYGGYSVFFLAGNHDGRFKSFIAHDGLFDLTSWYGTTEELFFANWDIGGPYWEEENKEAYQKFSPSSYVDKWDTPILIIQGGKDFRVPPEQGLQAFQAAKLKGLESKLLYFPDENHWILNGQNAMIWQNEFFQWLNRTLNR